MVQRWLQANRDAEAAGDWRPMADMYTEDATYGWNYGADTDFMAVGRDEIRDIALGAEMGGLDGWQYPYQEVVIDEAKGFVIGFWKQVADATRSDGSRYEVAGIGGSWMPRSAGASGSTMGGTRPGRPAPSATEGRIGSDVAGDGAGPLPVSTDRILAAASLSSSVPGAC